MAEPLFLFAHGAGAPSSHPWMQRWSKHLAYLGTVLTFDYPYMKERRKRPDPLAKLVASHREALVEARKQDNVPIILIGKSMGGRIGCHVACQEPVSAVICLGYPLCAAGDRTRARAEVLRALSTPILFVQGTRDSLCPLDLLAEVRKEMTAANDLYVVAGGDHSLIVAKSQLKAGGETQDQVEARILERISDFVKSNTH
jgi:predicted alpha/beta-hydrolase family hydrolase